MKPDCYRCKTYKPIHNGDCSVKDNCRYHWYMNQGRWAYTRRRKGWTETRIEAIRQQRQEAWEACHPDAFKPIFEEREDA